MDPAAGGVRRIAPRATHAPGPGVRAIFRLAVAHSMSTPTPTAVARIVVGTTAGAPDDPGDSATFGGRSVVLTLFRAPDGDGTYSLVMHRGARR